MANRARITRRWPDGDTLFVTIVADNSYPQALDEARAVAIRAYADALGITIASFATEPAEVMLDDGDGE